MLVHTTPDAGVPDLCSHEAHLQDSSQQHAPAPGSRFLSLSLPSEQTSALRVKQSPTMREGGSPHFPSLGLPYSMEAAKQGMNVSLCPCPTPCP